jgi:hypothetical protein
MIGVDPQWQGRGIARQLILASLVEARYRNINFARALIRTDNRPSQRAFAWCGFKPQPAPLFLYVAEPTELPAPAMPRDTHVISVDTLTYSGVWLEGRRSLASFLAARSLIHTQGRTTAGALIAVADAATVKAAEQADYMQIGEFDWWERAIMAAV